MTIGLYRQTEPVLADFRRPLRFFLYLRLLSLVLAALAISGWHLMVNSLPFVVWALLLVITVFVWTLQVLHYSHLREQRRAVLREIVLELAWVSLIAIMAGGASNPFIYYYLVIIALAALMLSPWQAWMICASSLAIYTLMLLLQVRAHFLHYESAYQLHLVGMWLNYLVSAVVVCFFVTTLVMALRQQYEQLQRTREINLKNEQLIALATVCASTIHNLATPLSTLLLTIEDMKQAQTDDTVHSEDLSVMSEQIRRCQNTIGHLSAMIQQGQVVAFRSTSSIVDDIREHYLINPSGREPFITEQNPLRGRLVVNDLFKYALINLINNALESTDTPVKVRFGSENGHFFAEIENSCSLTQAHLLREWGNPMVSAKRNGVGIGSFLANSTVEQIGGTVSINIESGDEDDVVWVCVRVDVPEVKPQQGDQVEMSSYE